MHFKKAQDLRYGENPHQKAAFFSYATRQASTSWKQLHGKELSYNNLLDVEATLDVLAEFSAPTACVIKHNNPCGCALAPDGKLLTAFQQAYAGDPVSAFGGVLGFNCAVDAETAAEIASPNRFVEAIVAPSYTPEALETLTTKPKLGKNVRLLATGAFGQRDRALKDVRVIPVPCMGRSWVGTAPGHRRQTARAGTR